MKPPMLEPRTQTLSASTPSISARNRAILPTSESASGLIGSSASAVPPLVVGQAAQPLAAQARPKSPWFSLRDPAPWRITIARQGGGDSGSQSM